MYVVVVNVLKRREGQLDARIKKNNPPPPKPGQTSKYGPLCKHTRSDPGSDDLPVNTAFVCSCISESPIAVHLIVCLKLCATVSILAVCLRMPTVM